jgi:hypothetical protein
LEYLVNVPIEGNCIKIELENNASLLIYALLRIVEKGKIILCDSDYYFDANNQEIEVPKKLEDTLLYDSLSCANEKLKNRVITDVAFNKWGDLTVDIGEYLQIQMFIDITEEESDYCRYYKDKYYYSLCRVKGELCVIYGELENEE